ncbi:MAG: ATP-binding protein [Kiritimatiellae bacterium]|jgi:predicted AAA+ superfamily ATPase|nr:ATP-binding protein [Kiritimatiellia bacterium]
MKRFAYKDVLAHIPRKQITLIIGARQVGKSTILKQLENELKNELVFSFSLENKKIRALLNETPENIFQLIPQPKNRRIIVLIDEIQYLDDPSNFLKLNYDLYQDKIKFVVTGSSSFYIDRKFNDSLAGRKRIFELSTLSLAEILHFSERDELVPFLNSGDIPLLYLEELRKYLYEYLVFGGYPEVVLTDDIDEKKLILKELGTSYARKDAVESNLHIADAYLNILKLLSSRTGSLVNANSLSADIAIDGKTIDSYLWVMRKSFHIDLVRPFYRNVSSEIRKMPKVYFNDLGLRNFFVNNFSPIGMREDKGALIENYVYLLLKHKYDSENVRYWRTQSKKEVDFVVCGDGGEYKAFEVKYDRRAYSQRKYLSFVHSYPDIQLRCVDVDAALVDVL